MLPKEPGAAFGDARKVAGQFSDRTVVMAAFTMLPAVAAAMSSIVLDSSRTSFESLP